MLIKVCTYIVWSTLKIRNLACWTRTDRLGELSIGCNVETHGGVVQPIRKRYRENSFGFDRWNRFFFFFRERDHRAKDLEETWKGDATRLLVLYSLEWRFSIVFRTPFLPPCNEPNNLFPRRSLIFCQNTIFTSNFFILEILQRESYTFYYTVRALLDFFNSILFYQLNIFERTFLHLKKQKLNITPLHDCIVSLHC